MSYDTIFPLLLFNKRDHGGFELDAVEESWLSTFSTLLQVFSRMLFNDVLCSVDYAPVEPIGLVSNCCYLVDNCVRYVHLLHTVGLPL